MVSVEGKIKKARLKAFRRDVGLLFFGNLMYKFDISIEEMKDTVEGFVRYDPQNVTKSLDGKIHVNKNFVGKEDYTHVHLLFLISHEIMHILRKDGVRRGTRDPLKWNVACDHCVDRDLKVIKTIDPYEGRYNIIPELNSQKPQCSAEEAYKWIIDNPQSVKIQLISGEGGEDVIKVTTSDGKSYIVNTNCGGVKQTKPMTTDQKLEYEEIIDQFVAQARALYQTIKDKGSISGGMSEMLDKLLKVHIPWESLLEKAIKTNTIQKPDERQWRQPNKMYLPLGITLPGVTMSEDTEGVGILVVTADSSGSVSTDELKKFSSVIVQSMKYFETIRLMVHDVDVHQVVDFDKDNIHEFLSFIKKEGYKGRGGTSHKPSFDMIEEDWKDRDFRDDLSMVISLTDGYSDLEHIYTDYNWLRSIPLEIVVTSGWHNDFEERDNVHVIQMKDDV